MIHMKWLARDVSFSFLIGCWEQPVSGWKPTYRLGHFIAAHRVRLSSDQRFRGPPNQQRIPVMAVLLLLTYSHVFLIFLIGSGKHVPGSFWSFIKNSKSISECVSSIEVFLKDVVHCEYFFFSNWASCLVADGFHMEPNPCDSNCTGKLSHLEMHLLPAFRSNNF